MAGITGYCVDSNILIDYLNGDKRAYEFLEKSKILYVLSISAVSITEIYAGKETQKPVKTAAIEELIGNFNVIEITAVRARLAGILRSKYKKPFADMIIAASAMDAGLSLVTRNIRDYQILKSEFALQGQEIIRPY